MFFFYFIVVIDIGSGCQSATFTLNDDSTISRAWDIKISQFACGDIDSGGPPGCLQYYKETYGIIQRFVRIIIIPLFFIRISFCFNIVLQFQFSYCNHSRKYINSFDQPKISNMHQKRAKFLLHLLLTWNCWSGSHCSNILWSIVNTYKSDLQIPSHIYEKNYIIFYKNLFSELQKIPP